MKKVFLILLLILFPVLASAYDFEVDGICYEIIKNNSVIVTCRYWDAESIYSDYKGDIIIPETVTYNSMTYTVTAIEANAFYGCNGLKSVIIPKSIMSIGYDAFYGCSGLTSVTIPYSVASIDNSAFRGCNGLTSIIVDSNNPNYDSRDNCNAIIETASNSLITGCKQTIIPSTVTSIGNVAFCNCTELLSIIIPNSVTTIGEASFFGCSGLTNMTIPMSVSSIGYNAFNSCTRLANINIPNSITTINSSVFEGCTSLTNIMIPNSVTFIGQSAFSGCTSLESITIPSSVESIGKFAFNNCSSLVTLYFNAKSCADFVYNYEPFNNTNISTIIIGDSVQKIPDYFAFKIRPKKLIWNAIFCSQNFGMNTSEIEEVTIGNKVQVIPEDFVIGSKIKTLNIPESVTSIKMNAFSNCSELSSIVIPNSVTYIDGGTFNECTRLTSIELPDALTEICESTFYGCTGLTSIRIPNTVQSIGNSAFYGCRSISSIVIPESITTIGNNAFRNCNGLKQLTWNAINCNNAGDMYSSNIEQLSIGDEVQTIPHGFVSESKIASITIPKSVATIGNSAFERCYNLTNIIVDSDNPNFDSRDNSNCIIETLSNSLILGCKNTIIPNSVKKINDQAFAYCKGLTFIEIPNSVIDIGGVAFQGCEDLEEIIMSNSVVNIGIGSFGNCSKLSNVTLPSSVKSIGSNAFSNCTNLTDVIFDNSSASIGSSAFDDCSMLTNVHLGDSILSIGSTAFWGCSKLASITIPESVKEIGWAAFCGCSSLMDVYSYISDPSAITMGESVFFLSPSNYLHRILYVPKGAFNAYRIDTNWSVYFGTIKEMESEPSYIRGDVDGDGKVNISDVTTLIDYLLRGSWRD